MNMPNFRPLASIALALAVLGAAPMATAQGVRAAVVNCPSSQVMLVQKMTSNLRWRVWTAAGAGAGSWSPWLYLGGNPIWHQTAGEPPAASGWCNRDGWRRFLAFYPVVDAATNVISMAELQWPGDPALLRPVERRVQIPAGSFMPRASTNWDSDQVSVFGLRARNNATNTLRYLPREAWFDGTGWNFVDWGTNTVPEADAIDMGPLAATVAFGPQSTMEHFLLYRETRGSAARVLLLHQPGPSQSQNEAVVDFGLPPNASSAGTPLLLRQGSEWSTNALNAFVVARLPSGERHLFERFNPTPVTTAADGTPGFRRWTTTWRDAGRPPVGSGPYPPDDMEITAAIVWNLGGVRRINLFGSRWGALVEYWWDGNVWRWSAGTPFPAAMGSGVHVVDAVATSDTQRPRLAVFAQGADGTVWERAWDWTHGNWLAWAPMN